jgi:catechol 2,3-dioxygenase-like lactoylglutathione lyase family enzyme
MLQRIDRIQLAVRDRRAAVQTFVDILGAEHVRDDESKLLSAHRSVVQAGESEFDLLEPAGDGPVAEHLERWREGIFAAGFSTDDISSLARRLDDRGVAFSEEGGQLFLDADQTRGMRTVISSSRDRLKVGLISWVYEVTNIVSDHEEAANFYTTAFGLDSARFSPIRSREFGYKGMLTLFDPPDRLDRIELTEITEPSLAMGRFFARRGPSIYMCYVETTDTGPLRERLQAKGCRFADGRENGGGNLFIHPTALHGMLMGVSRTNLAWTWSGRPELARA